MSDTDQKMDAIRRIAHRAGHDFNNILGNISTCVSLILNYLDNGMVDKGREQAMELIHQTQRAQALTTDLLTVGTESTRTRSTVFDANGVLHQIEPALRNLAGSQIRVSVNCAASDATVFFDQHGFERIIAQLVENARDAMPDGGTIRIATSEMPLGSEGRAEGQAAALSGSYLVVSVHDSGVGMDAATASQVFEPFFTTKKTGRGLGLSLAYSNLRARGGRIAFESAPRQGSTFRVFLPQPVKEALGFCGSETILFVEDDGAVRAMIGGELRRRGYYVIEAAWPSDALSRGTEERPIDLLLTDVVMPEPEMSGSELSQRLKMRRPKLKTLYISGYRDSNLVDQQLLEVGVPFIQKPFALEALARKVREVLDSKP